MCCTTQSLHLSSLAVRWSFVFFFSSRRRHTISDRDWSSDVCSSDLDSLISPFTSLHGSTRIGSGCTIGPLTTMIDTSVGDGAAVLHSYVKEADVGPKVDRKSVV